MAAAALVAFQLGVPAKAEASGIYNNTICTATGLNVCLNFNLSYNSAQNYYTLVTTYVSSTAPSGEQGYITAVGVYDTNLATDFNLTVTGATGPTGSSWCWDPNDSNCNINDLNGNGNIVLLAGAADNTSGGVNGLQVGESLTIKFTSGNSVTEFENGLADSGTVGLRAHVQSFGPNECSMKPDTRADGNVFSVGSDCGPEVVPEPATVVLLATGFLALLGFAYVRHAV